MREHRKYSRYGWARFTVTTASLAALMAVGTMPAAISPASAETAPRVQSEENVDENYRGELGVTMAMARQELLGLPNYDVFDWIEAEIFENGSVVLEGRVVEATTKQDATARVESIDGVTQLTNNIEVLPPSPTDDRIRRAVYDAIYGSDSPLSRFAGRTIPPVHIIVDQGRVTLEGNLDAEVNRQYVANAARSIFGVLSVENEIQLDTGA